MSRTEEDTEEMKRLSELVFEGFAGTFNLNQEMVEEWSTRTHQTLLLLIESNYRQEEEEFFEQTKMYCQVMEHLLERPELERLIGKGGVMVLERGFGKVIDRAHESIAAQISEVEIGLFCLLAEGGRNMFQDENYNPNDFVPEPVFILAKHIRENYGAYEETLQGLRA